MLERIETPTLYVSGAHFLLLFGYKLFSLYYPLFLAMQGFSAKTIGSMYLLIYFTIAIASPFLNFWARKHSVSRLLALSVLGYAAYSLGMIYSRTTLEFALFQILLGISSGLFYISARSILIESKPKKPEESFAYFYSAPLYSMLLAPLLGGFVILKAGFSAVFYLSVAVYVAASVLSYAKLRNFGGARQNYTFNEYSGSYSKILSSIKSDKKFLGIASVAFVSLLATGAYRTFFVLFLGNVGFSQDKVVTFVAIGAAASIIFSWQLAKMSGRYGGVRDILLGTSVSGIFTIAIAYLSNAYALFAAYMGDFAGRFLSESGKSGWLAEKFKKYSEEAATIDTAVTSLGVALGALAGGFIVDAFGYRGLFAAAGIVSVVFGMLASYFAEKRLLSRAE